MYLRRFFIILTCFYLTGCGQTGPLYLPPKTNANAVTATTTTNNTNNGIQ